MWGTNTGFTRFAYTPPGYPACGRRQPVNRYQADSSRDTIQTDGRKNARQDRFLSLQAVFILSLHPIQGRQGSRTREGKEGRQRQTKDRQCIRQPLDSLEGVKTAARIACILWHRYALPGYVLGCLYRYI